MSAVLSRWPVLREHPVTAADLDADDQVSDEAVERWVADASSAYLDLCARLQAVREQDGLELSRRTRTLPKGAALGQPTSVVVSASATELRPSSFTISVRLRAVGGDREVAANATCTVALTDPGTGEAHQLDDRIRDELISVEQSARYFN